MADDFVNCGRCEEITHRGWSNQCSECNKIFCKSCEVCDIDDDSGCDKPISITEKKFEELYNRLHKYANEIHRLKNKYNDNDFIFSDYNMSSESDTSDSDNVIMKNETTKH